MKVSLSLGGSIVTENLNPEYIGMYAEAILHLHRQGHQVFVVVGAGSIKDKYIDVVSGLGLSNDVADTIAIKITHLNALLISMALKGAANQKIPETEDEIESAIESSESSGNILVCGGTKPGQSTDAVAAFIAAKAGADVIITASNVDGVYDSDPKKNPNAKKILKMTHDELERIISQNEQTPGKYKLFDMRAARIAKENKIMIVMVDGSDPKEIIKAVLGNHSGTTIGETNGN